MEYRIGAPKLQISAKEDRCVVPNCRNLRRKRWRKHLWIGIIRLGTSHVVKFTFTSLLILETFSSTNKIKEANN